MPKNKELTFKQIDGLAKGIAMDLAGLADKRVVNLLMLLMADIAEYGDNAETIANLLNSYLMVWCISEYDKAERTYIAGVQQRVLPRIEASL